MEKEIKTVLEDKVKNLLNKDIKTEIKYLQIEADKSKVMYSKKYEDSELYYITCIDR